MRSFFSKAELLYEFLTINTHVHLHLQNVFKDYGPCYGYWLFSFEDTTVSLKNTIQINNQLKYN